MGAIFADYVRRLDALYPGAGGRMFGLLTGREICEKLELPRLAGRLMEADLSDEVCEKLLVALHAIIPPSGEAPFVSEAHLRAAAEDPDGWVYFLLSNESGRIKIGFSKDVRRRIATMRTALAGGVTLLATLPGNRYLEKTCTLRFLLTVCRFQGVAKASGLSRPPASCNLSMLRQCQGADNDRA